MRFAPANYPFDALVRGRQLSSPMGGHTKILAEIQGDFFWSNYSILCSCPIILMVCNERGRDAQFCRDAQFGRLYKNPNPPPPYG